MWIFPDDEYHQHYPDAQNDYGARLLARAPRIADYRKLICKVYPDDTESWRDWNWGEMIR